MKEHHLKILFFGLVAAVLIAALSTTASAKDKEGFWSQERAGRRDGRGRGGLTEEKLERIIERLKEADPESAKELSAIKDDILRDRKMRRHDRSEGKEFWGRRDKDYSRKGCPTDRREEKGLWSDKKEFGRGKEFGHGRKEYQMHERVKETLKKNPQIIELREKGRELKKSRHELLRKIRGSTDKGEKAELTKKLREVLSSRFDLIIERKQIEYDLMQKKMEKLKARLEQRQGKVENWKSQKEKRVEERLEKLLEKSEEFDWD